jgi:alpha-tubulin suppressor-like RCC1 family protein
MDHGCVLLRDATVRCWGWNDNYGQLGDGSGRDQLRPVAPAGLSDVAQLVALSTTTCAVTGDGAVWCWGALDRGMPGGTERGVSPRPRRIALPGPVRTLRGHCAVLREEARPVCWGVEAPGYRRMLFAACAHPEAFAIGGPVGRHGGYEHSEDEIACNEPTPVPGLSDIEEADVSSLFGCARRRDGAVLCWGVNFYGSLGDGGTADSAAPRRVQL